MTGSGNPPAMSTGIVADFDVVAGGDERRSPSRGSGRISAAAVVVAGYLAVVAAWCWPASS